MAHARALSVAIVLAIAGVPPSARAAPPRARVVTAAPVPSAQGQPLVPLQVRLLDGKTGLEISGNVRITGAEGRALDLAQAEAAPSERRPGGWYAAAGTLALRVPAEPLEIEAFQGLETLVARRAIEPGAAGNGEVELTLERFVRARQRGIAAGNTQLLQASGDRARAALRLATAADALDFAWLSGDHETLPSSESLASLTTAATRFGGGMALERDFRGGGLGAGRVLLLDLPMRAEAALTRALRAPDPSLSRDVEAVRTGGGTAIWARGGAGAERLPSWVLGRVDAQSLFDAARAETTRRAADDARLAYDLLDLGLAVPLATGSESLGDLARVYVPMRGEWSTAEFLSALRAGHSFVTNGPLLELDVDGAGPGDVVKRAAPGAVHVRARAVGRVDFGALEVVANGRVVARTESLSIDGHAEAGIDGGVALDGPAWIAARVAPGEARSELGAPLFAHTSAVTVEVAGARPFRSSSAREVALAIDWSARALSHESHFVGAKQRARALAPYAQAIERLGARMGWLDWLRTWAVRVLRSVRGWFGR